jgi:tetratricopeptide (TPR) repeat protein/O-antigen ligase
LTFTGSAEAANPVTVSKRRVEPKKDHPTDVDGFFGALLVVVALLTTAGVCLVFSLEVNRVFDVPKAVILKLGGGGALLLWLAYGTFSRGFFWDGTRPLLGPIAFFCAAVVLSTLFSIDPVMSLRGVYERQFGLQGVLACAGLFVAIATGLRSRRGAKTVLVFITVLTGILGAYAAVQAHGLDPFPFFREPSTKVYSFLGNATFAGNALALTFPIALAVTVCALVQAIRPSWATPELEAPESDQSGARSIVIASAVSLVVLMVCIVLGLIYTRTRGAWVATAVSLACMMYLSGGLFPHRPQAQKMLRIGTAALVGACSLLVLGFAVGSDHLYARTIRSIPAAFNPNRTDHGKGQGTRPYLWSESPRVLFSHQQTIERKNRDLELYRAHVNDRQIEFSNATNTIVEVPFRHVELSNEFDPSWRRWVVYLFGIGIETYRYAFMSHKSERLEALDPMTNHDNPHNNYLYILASLGLFGFAAYTWLLWKFLSWSFKNCSLPARNLVRTQDDGALKGDLVTSVHDDVRGQNAFLTLETANAPLVLRVIQFSLPDTRAQIQKGRVVVSGSSSEMLRQALQKILLPPKNALDVRILALGIVGSFVSYAVYSIAGFDSVACAVFLFILFGASSVLLREESHQLPRRRIHAHLWHEFQRTSSHWGIASERIKPLFMAGTTAVTLVIAIIACTGMFDAVRTWQAERAYVSSADERGFEAQVAKVTEAILDRPDESFYRQRLATLFDTAAEQYRQQSTTEDDRNGAYRKLLIKEADAYSERSEILLYSSLDHAWAPENIFISLFQHHYRLGKDVEAKAALELALSHSPHLAPLRANLAALELDQDQAEQALNDCEHALRIDPANVLALRVCGRASGQLGNLEPAEKYLLRAKRLVPEDETIGRWLEELRAQKTP